MRWGYHEQWDPWGSFGPSWADSGPSVCVGGEKDCGGHRIVVVCTVSNKYAPKNRHPQRGHSGCSHPKGVLRGNMFPELRCVLPLAVRARATPKPVHGKTLVSARGFPAEEMPGCRGMSCKTAAGTGHDPTSGYQCCLPAPLAVGRQMVSSGGGFVSVENNLD